MSGRAVFDRISIPSGVTVTAEGDLSLFARGRIEMVGDLVGVSSARLFVQSESTLVVKGTIRNSAAAPPEIARELVLVGKRGVTLIGADLQSSLRVVVVNDSLDQAGLLDGPGGTSPIAIDDAKLRIFPVAARSGAVGATGGAGADGGSIVVLARGPLTLARECTIEAQRGGDGGDASQESAVNASASGGAGGAGGGVTLRSRSRIELAASSTCTLTSGDGGKGGRADASGLPNGDGDTAPSAEATGGAGGMGGLIALEAANPILLHGAMILNVGSGGDGGVGNALGADGHFATESPAQAGGDANASGGVGGSSRNPARSFISIVGGSLELSGGTGGEGGYVAAVPGRGGNGGATHRTGGAGGNAIARGGDGGASNVTDAQVYAGGFGGAVLVQGARGGEGFAACASVDQAGGTGGPGGSVDAKDGKGGPGLPEGAPGGILLAQCGNGGGGGKGNPPGNGGAGGGKTAEAFGEVDQTEPSFSAGPVGSQCGSGSGACCTLGGTCSITTAVLCSQTGGTYHGDDTICDAVNCDLTRGACCSLDGSCTVRTEAECELAGGVYSGGGSDCDPNPCAGEGSRDR